MRCFSSSEKKIFFLNETEFRRFCAINTPNQFWVFLQMQQRRRRTHRRHKIIPVFFSSHNFSKYFRCVFHPYGVCVCGRVSTGKRFSLDSLKVLMSSAGCQLPVCVNRPNIPLSSLLLFVCRNASICWTQWEGLFSWRLLIESSFSLYVVWPPGPRPHSTWNNGTTKWCGRRASTCVLLNDCEGSNMRFLFGCYKVMCICVRAFFGWIYTGPPSATSEMNLYSVLLYEIIRQWPCVQR